MLHLGPLLLNTSRAINGLAQRALGFQQHDLDSTRGCCQLLIFQPTSRRWTAPKNCRTNLGMA